MIESTQNPSNTAPSGSEVVFIDSRVNNYQTLVADLPSTTKVIILDSQTDGIAQIQQALADQHDLKALHIISHGVPGVLYLGSSTLNADSMQHQYAQQLRALGAALAVESDIFIYGCDFAQGAAGQEAMGTLRELVHADVAASTNPTGHSQFGGDWQMEAHLGTIETPVIITPDQQANWLDTLVANTAPVLTPTVTTLSYTEKASPVVIDPGITVFDSELNAADNYNNATVRLTTGGFNPQNIYANSGTLGALKGGLPVLLGGVNIGTVTYESWGTVQIAFNSNATQARVNSALQQITYSNITDTPTANLTTTWTFNDGNTGAQGTGGQLSTTADVAMTITPTNTAPYFITSNLVANGTFTTDLSSWTTSGTWMGTGSARAGSGSVTGPHSLSQTVTTIAGQTYALSFFTSDDRDEYTQAVRVTANGNGSLFDTGPLNTNQGQTYRYSFTADSSATTITLTDISDTPGVVNVISLDGSQVDTFFDDITLSSLSKTGTISHTPNTSPVLLAPTLNIFDPEMSLANYNGATLSLTRSGGANADDVFSATGTLGALVEGGNLSVGGVNIGTVTTNSNGSLALTFNSSATQARINSTLTKIAYQCSNATPSVYNIGIV